MNARRVAKFVDSLRRNRRATPFTPDPDDVFAMRAAIELNSTTIEASSPQPEFVAELRRRLAEQADHTEATSGVAAARVGRRRVVELAAAAAAAAVTGGVLDRGLLASGSAVSIPKRQELIPDAGSWNPVGTTADVADGQVVRFSTASTVGFVVNDNGKFSAISGVCTHQGCLLRHNEAERRLDCPCHRASFSLQGDVLHRQFRAPLAPLPHLQVRENNGLIEINEARLV